MDPFPCPVCHTSMQAQRVSWLRRCPTCGFLAATLEPAINTESSEEVDEVAREDALGPLRRRTFEVILDALEAVPGAGPRLLDVGCAHGWFLEMAADRGYTALGLEPDLAVAERTRRRGLDVAGGYFPDDLANDTAFDVISFNDVLEHIPGPDRVIADVHPMLDDGGLLVVNIPVSSGFFYRVASTLARVGIRGPLERMWQTSFPSPHLSYLTTDHVRAIAERVGFEVVSQQPLLSLTRHGLWARLRYDRSASLAGSVVVYVATLAMLPIVRVLPSDSALVLLRKVGPDTT